MEEIRASTVSLLNSEYCSNKIKTEYFDNFSRTSSSFQTFSDKNVSELLRHVNRSTSNAKSRLEGLLLLSSIVDQCSADVLQENVSAWNNMLLGIIQSYNDTRVHQVAALLLCDTLREASGFPELARDVSTTLIPALIPALLNSDGQWDCEALRCIQTCLKHYTGASTPFRLKVESKLLSSVLEARLPTNQLSLICQTLPLLAACGVGGASDKSAGSRHKNKSTEGWGIYIDRILGSLHNVLDSLYCDLETDDGHLRPELSLFPPPPLGGDPDRTYSLQNHFSFLCQALGQMLEPGVVLTAQVPLDDILTFICRALAISPKFLMNRPTHRRTLLCSVLPTIHQLSLGVLKQLVICLECALTPRCQLVNKLLTQTLTAYSGAATAHGQKPFSGVRRSVYDVLTSWLVLLGGNSGVSMVTNALLPHVLEDCAPVSVSKPQTKLESADVIWSKKKKRKSGQNDESSSWQLRHDGKGDRKLCLAALNALEQMVLKCGSFMKSVQHKTIQEFVLPLLVTFSTTTRCPAPYSNPGCRHGVYSVLQACILVCSPSWPPPIHMALGLLRRASITEHDLQLRGFIQRVQLVCQSTIHPRVPPIVAPSTLTELISDNSDVTTTAPPQIQRVPLFTHPMETTNGIEFHSDSEAGPSGTQNEAPTNDVDIMMVDDESEEESDGDEDEEDEKEPEEDLEDKHSSVAEIISDDEDTDGKIVTQVISSDDSIHERKPDDESLRAPEGGDGATSGVKRKISEVDEPEKSTSKREQDNKYDEAEVDLMLQSFVNDGPDLD